MALNLGGLFFTLDADTRGLMSAQRRVERFASTVRSAFRGVGRGTVDPGMANQLARQERAIISSMERIKRVQETVARTGFQGTFATQAQVQLANLGRAYDNFTRKMAGGVPLNSLDFGRRVQHMNSQINDATRNIQRLRTEASKGPNLVGWGRMNNMMQGLGHSALVVQGHWGGMSTRFFALTGLIREFGLAAAIASASVAGLGVGIGLLGSHAVRAGMTMQQLTVQFEALTNNAAVAGTHLDFVREVAGRAGLAFETTARGYARFLASSQAGGLSLEQTRRAFNGVALASATMQLSVEDTQGVFRALDQMMSKGTVQAEELRGQLGDRLPGAFVIAATAMGVTTRRLGEMMKKGELVSREFVPRFVETLQRMWNIDPDAPIQTLRASIQRLSNEWLYFGAALDQATGATRSFAGIVDSLASALEWLGNNMQSIILWAGTLAGALLSLAAAFIAMQLVTTISQMWALVAVYNVATRSIMVAATAQNVLNAAMVFFQNIPIVRILTAIAIALGGGVIAYNMLNNAMRQNNAAMSSSMDHMRSYIEQQRRMGFQVRATTTDLIRQANVQFRIANARSVELASQAAARARSPSIMDYLNALPAGGRGFRSPYEFAQRNADRMMAEAHEAQRVAGEWASVISGLGDIGELPDISTTIQNMADEGDETARSLQGIINKIKDLRDEARTARMQLEALFAPLAEGQTMSMRLDAIEDMGEAIRIVNNLTPQQLGAAAGVLGVPASIQAVTAAIADLITEARVAQEVIRDFVSIWEDLDEGERQLRNINRQIDLLESVGGDLTQAPGQMAFLQQLGEAEEMIASLQESGPDGIRVLERISQRLRDAGYEGNNVAELIANFFAEIEEGQAQVQVLEEVGEKFRKLRDELQQLSVLQQAYSSRGGLNVFAGAGFGDIFAADIGEAAERAVARGQAVRDLRRELEAVGTPQEVINQKTREYLDLLRMVDDQRYVFDRLQEQAERTRDSFRDMVRDGLTNIRDLIMGVKDLGDALMDLATNILNSLWQRYIMQPIDNMLLDMGRTRGEAGATGLDAQVAGMNALGQAANDAAGAVNDNFIGAIINSATQAAQQAITATTANAAEQQRIATEIQATVATNVLTAALGALTTAASAAAAALASVAASETGSKIASIVKVGAEAAAAYAGAPSKALGGYASAGSVYQINEPGLTGEYFIPSVSGYLSNQPANDVGPSVHVDARTYIDARGATRDAVAELRREMAARDAQMASQLPYMIDARVQDSSNRRRYSA